MDLFQRESDESVEFGPDKQEDDASAPVQEGVQAAPRDHDAPHLEGYKIGTSRDVCVAYREPMFSKRAYRVQEEHKESDTKQCSEAPNLVPKRGQHEYRRNFFSLRVVEAWNSLPMTVRDAPTVSSFKRLYRRHLETAAAPAMTAN